VNVPKKRRQGSNADTPTSPKKFRKLRNFVLAHNPEPHHKIMAGIKRKDVSDPAKPKTKKLKPSPAAAKSAVRSTKPTKKPVKRAPSVDSELSESDIPEEENGFLGFSEKGRLDEGSDDDSMSSDKSDEEVAPAVKGKSKAGPVKDSSATRKTNGTSTSNNHLGDEGVLGGMSICHLTIDLY